MVIGTESGTIRFTELACKTRPSWSRFGPMNTILPFSEVNSRLSELADRVEHQEDRILVTRNGRPSFILVNCDYLESLEETLDIMRDPELVASLRRSRAEAEAGLTLPLRDCLNTS